MVDSYRELRRLYKGVTLYLSSATNGYYPIKIPLVAKLWNKCKSWANNKKGE